MLIVAVGPVLAITIATGPIVTYTIVCPIPFCRQTIAKVPLVWLSFAFTLFEILALYKRHHLADDCADKLGRVLLLVAVAGVPLAGTTLDTLGLIARVRTDHVDSTPPFLMIPALFFIVEPINSVFVVFVGF